MTSASNDVRHLFAVNTCQGHGYRFFLNDNSSIARKVAALGHANKNGTVPPPMTSGEVLHFFVKGAATWIKDITFTEPVVFDFIGDINGEMEISRDGTSQGETRFFLVPHKEELPNTGRDMMLIASMYDNGAVPNILWMNLAVDDVRATNMYLNNGGNAVKRFVKDKKFRKCMNLFVGDGHLPILQGNDVVGRVVNVQCYGDISIKR